MHESSTISATKAAIPGTTLGQAPGSSWNEQTRRVITARLSIDPDPRFFTADEFQTVLAIAARIVPQPAARPPIPVAALVDEKLFRGASDGDPGAECRAMARRGGLEKGARCRSDNGPWRMLSHIGRRTSGPIADAMNWDSPIRRMGGMPAMDFFSKRMARGIVLADDAHPTAWSESGGEGLRAAARRPSRLQRA